MCGVLAAFSKSDRPIDPERFSEAMLLLGHRGPDFEMQVTELGGRLRLAQSVLSICGRPQADPDRYATSSGGCVQVAYNGEIYNFRELNRRHCEDAPLRTGSDTEVLANLLERLELAPLSREIEGMYAFVAFDRARQRLVVARDCAGEKPLYRYEDAGMLVIASEVRAILHLAVGARLDVSTLREYLWTRHFMPGRRTEFIGIERVPAGSWQEFDLAGCRWRSSASCALDDKVDAQFGLCLQRSSMDELTELLDHELQLVAEQLLPECAYACVVSGGIDSTLLASYFLSSARTPAYLPSLDFGGVDPIARARPAFERALGATVDLHAATVEEFGLDLERFYLHHRGLMPTHSLVSMAMLTRRVSERGLRVLIGGDGADELFGGYGAYADIDIEVLATCEQSPSPYSGLSALPQSLAGEPGWEREYDESRAARRDQWRHALATYAHLPDPEERGFSAMLHLDSGIQLESVGLTSSDRMSMLNSVESRSPFVHPRILRLALNLPMRARCATDGAAPMRGKHILKQLFALRVDPALVYAKQGFPGFPNEAGRKLCGGDFRRVSEVLELPEQSVRELLLQRAGEWKLINLELFLRGTSA